MLVNDRQIKRETELDLDTGTNAFLIQRQFLGMAVEYFADSCRG